MSPSTITLKCKDGVQLPANFYQPEKNTKGLIIIASALAVPRKFYHHIALYFAESQYSVLTFDYRGVADSPLTKKPRLAEWGTQDIQAAVAAAGDLPGGDNLFLVGHSIGGQLVGIVPSADKLEGIVLVAASFPYWKRFSMPEKLKVGLMFRVIAPLFCLLSSTFPARALGLGSSQLPSSLIADWAAWIGKDNYLLDKKFGFDAEGYKRLKQPLLAYGFDDDPLVPKASFNKILSAYSSASIENRFTSIKHTPVGHLGFFRSSSKDTFWLDTLDWINKVSEERSSLN